MPSSSQKKTSFGTNSECRVFVVIADVVDLTWLYSAFWYLKKNNSFISFCQFDICTENMKTERISTSARSLWKWIKRIEMHGRQTLLRLITSMHLIRFWFIKCRVVHTHARIWMALIVMDVAQTILNDMQLFENIELT